LKSGKILYKNNILKLILKHISNNARLINPFEKYFHARMLA
jgi:hypothetical protein